MNNASDPPSLSAVRSLADRPRPCHLFLDNPCRYREAGARRFRPWLAQTVAAVAPAATSLVVRFVSDREMRRLNATYRGQDKPTDVLSFPGDLTPEDLPGLEDTPEGGEVHLGDIIVSVPTARRQAAEQGHSVERELRVLVLHGLLHCLGHDHETDDGEMLRLERRLRRRLIDGPGVTARHAHG